MLAMARNVLICSLVLSCLSIVLDVLADVSDPDADPYKPLPIAEINPKEKDISYWHNQALNTLDEKLNKKLNTHLAKNIIFFLGDGMSIPTITAARMYKGQLQNRTGEEEKLFFETFPFTGLSKTYCVDKQVPDSACTATAYMTGVKTNFRGIGISAEVNKTDCEKAKIKANRPSSLLEWAQDAGKGTGVVTNTRVTHASPAGCYAHVPNREMECDSDVVKENMDVNVCNFDIAQQLIEDEPGRNIKVIMGGGRNKFLPKDNANSIHGVGSRLSKDLIEIWKQDKLSRKANAVYVTDANGLDKVDTDHTDYLLGLFNPEHMDYHLDENQNEPPLWKMTEKAIKILQKEKNGFFLFVEGGQIDFGHHQDQAKRALDETVEFDKAIKTATELTSETDTLIVVTADHAHTMSMSGYPARGNNILGLYGKSNDGLPYSTLSYANGLGYHKEGGFITGHRYNLENDNLDDNNYRFPALVPKDMETHGGDDVAVYARGPWAHLFSGNYEQNYIPIAEAYAAHVGPSSSREVKSNSATHRLPSHFIIFISSAMMMLLSSRKFS